MLHTLAIINLVVAIQSILLTTHFLTKKKGIQLLNRVIALITFSLSWILLNTYVSLSESPVSSTVLQELANNGMWFIGPALFTYINYREVQLDRNYLLRNFGIYFIPLVLDLLFWWPRYDQVIPFIGFLQISIYLILSIRACIKALPEKKDFVKWILPAVLAFSILVLVNFTLAILGAFDVYLISQLALQGLTVILFIPIYYISYMEVNSAGNFGLKEKKYKSSPLDPKKQQAYLALIERAFQFDRVHTESDLTLDKLSKKISVPSKYISQLINQEKHKNFSEFLNAHRIEEAKLNLKDPSKQHFSIAGIASESGFASVSRFNHLFKEATGMTPSVYQKSPPQ